MRTAHCLFPLILAACSPAGGGRGGAEDPLPNVLLVSIDTLRADRLGCYGYERDTSPNLDRFARERAVRFELAVAESSWTLPSHVTMLTGLHPLTHGAVIPARAASGDVEFLAETLARAGYYTFGLTDGGWLSRGWGFDRGFRSFEAVDNDFSDCVDDAIDYMRHRSGKGPWFGFLHTYDVHCPYDPPEPWFSRYQSPGAVPVEVEGRCGNPHFNEQELASGEVQFLSDRYDGSVRRVDEALGRLFDHLDATGAWDDTIVIVTSDHGEEFGEHGQVGHERTLHREALFVPLLIAVPGHEPRLVRSPVGLADIVPTVLGAIGVGMGLQPEGSLDGTDLRELLRLGGTDEGAVRYSHLAWKEGLFARVNSEEHAILATGKNEEVLRYALDDVAQAEDLCGSLPCAELASALRRALEQQAQKTRKTFVVEELEGH